MKTSAILYGAAKEMRRGFSPRFIQAGSCGCFIAAIFSSAPGPVNAEGRAAAIDVLRPIVGGSFAYDDLIAAGFGGHGATDDAVAALTIAADIAAAEGL